MQAPDTRGLPLNFGNAFGQPLLILGASARAAAHSARRAGFAPRAADLFCDADLLSCCPARRVADYPLGLEAMAREFPDSPWMYTGGLENHSALVDRIARQRPLWGNPGSVLRDVRNPFRVAQVLREAELPHARASSLPISGTPCLRKPRHSGGGLRISMVPTNESFAASDAWYFQEFIAGLSMSAVYVAGPSHTLLLGVTRQLIGEAWTGAGGFRYCGSLGPVSLTDARRSQYQQLGSLLAGRFQLRGLFGLDVIENDDGVFPVEINPRYTASVEVLERGLSIHAVGLQAAAWCKGLIPSSIDGASNICHGKAILYARNEFDVPQDFARFVERENASAAWPVLADIPQAGSRIGAREPIVSLFSSGNTLTEAEQNLRQLSALVSQWISQDYSP